MSVCKNISCKFICLANKQILRILLLFNVNPSNPLTSGLGVKLKREEMCYKQPDTSSGKYRNQRGKTPTGNTVFQVACSTSGAIWNKYYNKLLELLPDIILPMILSNILAWRLHIVTCIKKTPKAKYCKWYVMSSARTKLLPINHVLINKQTNKQKPIRLEGYILL